MSFLRSWFQKSVPKSNVRPEIGEVHRAVHEVHCQKTEDNYLIGLPKEWQKALSVINDLAAPPNQLEKAYKSCKKLPTPTCNKELIIFKQAEKIAMTREQASAMLQKVCLTSNPLCEFEILNLVGQGTFGNVYACQHKKTKRLYAIKQCGLGMLSCGLSVYFNEIIALSKLTHPNVIKLKKSYFYQSLESLRGEVDVREPVPFAVMELMDTSLGYVIDAANQNGFLPENIILYIMHNVLSGLSYIHSMSYIHLDIKSDNVLISRHGNVKIGDFGLSERLLYPDERKTSLSGTTLWMAPELCELVILSEKKAKGAVNIDVGSYDYRVDIWATGILLIELFDGNPPYYDEYTKHGQEAVKLKIISSPPGRIRRKHSEKVDVLRSTMLKQNPLKRWNCSRILELDLFNEMASRHDFRDLLCELHSYLTSQENDSENQALYYDI